MMEFAYDLLVSACTAILLSFIVAKLVSLAVCSSEVGGRKGLCAGVDNGEKQKGLMGCGVEEGTLEKRLKVQGLKSKKNRVKSVSAETVFVSEFEGKTEPAVLAKNLGNLHKADDFVDDRRELGSVEKDIQFLGMEVDMAYLGDEASGTSYADQLLSLGKVGGVELSGTQKEDDYFALDGPVENEGRISSRETTLRERVVEEETGLKEEVGGPIEGFDQKTNSGKDLDRLIVYDGRKDYREDDVVAEEMASCDFNQNEDVGIVGHGEEDSVKGTGNGGGKIVDQQLVNIVITERREVRIVPCGQDEGTESSEPKKDDAIDVGFLGGENGVDNQDEHQRVSESVETQWKDQSEGGSVDQVDELHEEIRFSVSKENVVNRKEEGRIVGDDKGEMEISDGEEWEGIERNELERDFAKAMSFVESSDKEGQLNKLGSDVLTQFHDLQKVAMEGSCLEPQPMALKLSPSAKWNAWRKSGSMNSEEAMEKYITLLSDKIPGWMDGHPSVEGENNSVEDGPCSSSDANLSTPLTLPLTHTDESKPGEEPVMGTSDLTGSSSSVNKVDE